MNYQMKKLVNQGVLFNSFCFISKILFRKIIEMKSKIIEIQQERDQLIISIHNKRINTL